MKLPFNIFFLLSYSFGVFCLPLGDFSLYKDLPAMYRHCKATEDKDMSPLDFVTDHLINIDGLFDDHGNGDEQKPHAANGPHFNVQKTISYLQYFTLSARLLNTTTIRYREIPVSTIFDGYFSELLRPPIV